MQEPEPWTDNALCADDRIDPEIFFDPLRVRDAKTWCALCPVVKECLTFAIKDGIPHGVFGGYSEEERRKLTKKIANKIAY